MIEKPLARRITSAEVFSADTPAVTEAFWVVTNGGYAFSNQSDTSCMCRTGSPARPE